MAKGYLANVTAIPPLIFKFQFHPEILSEKKSFEYVDDVPIGKWKFAETKAAATDAASKGASLSAFAKGSAATASGLVEDFANFGPPLVATNAMRPKIGKPRSFALEFAIDAEKPDEMTTGSTFEPVGEIESQLAVLRSFMNPGFDVLRDVPALIGGKEIWKAPPTCMLKLGDVELTCVMNDLNIKVTKFKPDLSPGRAEISLTLTEHTQSLSTVADVLMRNIAVIRSFSPGEMLRAIS